MGHRSPTNIKLVDLQRVHFSHPHGGFDAALEEEHQRRPVREIERPLAAVRLPAGHQSSNLSLLRLARPSVAVYVLFRVDILRLDGHPIFIGIGCISLRE
ncbi:hypothetical protein [Burkholderia sp. BCC0044]|uniref:hypothetical protein n=1 Tax=Burkholderia sp. BCC0044 TaxID=2676295 RepID=UPI00158F29E1|nr:hypothetical protein [Burkholderia sp. BCC0044]